MLNYQNGFKECVWASMACFHLSRRHFMIGGASLLLCPQTSLADWFIKKQDSYFLPGMQIGFKKPFLDWFDWYKNLPNEYIYIMTQQ